MNTTLETLAQIRGGDFCESLDEEFAHLVDAVRDTGKGGTITVKLTIKPASKGDDTTLTVSDVITTKLPQPDIGETIMYASDGGSLTRRDPRQMHIDDLKPTPINQIRETK